MEIVLELRNSGALEMDIGMVDRGKKHLLGFTAALELVRNTYRSGACTGALELRGSGDGYLGMVDRGKKHHLGFTAALELMRNTYQSGARIGAPELRGSGDGHLRMVDGDKTLGNILWAYGQHKSGARTGVPEYLNPHPPPIGEYLQR